MSGSNAFLFLCCLLLPIAERDLPQGSGSRRDDVIIIFEEIQPMLLKFEQKTKMMK
jgi:hypothetical protein